MNLAQAMQKVRAANPKLTAYHQSVIKGWLASQAGPSGIEPWAITKAAAIAAKPEERMGGIVKQNVLARLKTANPGTLEGAMARYDVAYPWAGEAERARVKAAIEQRAASNPDIQKAVRNGQSLFDAAFNQGQAWDSYARGLRAQAPN